MLTQITTTQIAHNGRTILGQTQLSRILRTSSTSLSEQR